MLYIKHLYTFNAHLFKCICILDINKRFLISNSKIIIIELILKQIRINFNERNNLILFNYKNLI